MLGSPEPAENAGGSSPNPTGPMTTAALETAADHVAERAADVTGLRPPFEIIDVDGELQLRLYDEPLVIVRQGEEVPDDLKLAGLTAEAVGDWFADELLDVRGWTAADLVSVREQEMERQLDGVESRVKRRLATLLRRRFVDPRTCFHGPHGGVVGSLTFDVASAPPARRPDDAETDWLAVDRTVPNNPDGPAAADGWPTTGLHVWNATSVEAFFPAGDDPLDPFDVDVLELIQQMAVRVGTEVETAVPHATRELAAHGEAYLRPTDDAAVEWDEPAFSRGVEAVPSAVEVPHRLDVEGFRARLVRRDDHG